MTDLSGLIARLEALTGPDGAIDYEIHTGVKLGYGVGTYDDHPHYTLSLEAAMSLVPKPYLANLESCRTERGDQYTWILWHPEDRNGVRCGPRRFSAIALCIACLKARQA